MRHLDLGSKSLLMISMCFQLKKSDLRLLNLLNLFLVTMFGPVLDPLLEMFY